LTSYADKVTEAKDNRTEGSTTHQLLGDLILEAPGFSPIPEEKGWREEEAEWSESLLTGPKSCHNSNSPLVRADSTPKTQHR